MAQNPFEFQLEALAPSVSSSAAQWDSLPGTVSTAPEFVTQLLTIARNRARLLETKNMNPSNTEKDSQLLRGAYIELHELIKALEARNSHEV